MMMDFLILPKRLTWKTTAVVSAMNVEGAALLTSKEKDQKLKKKLSRSAVCFIVVDKCH